MERTTNRIVGRSSLIVTILLFSILVPLFSSSKIVAQDILLPYGESINLKDLQWNRYVTNNFVILSIDDSQGKWISRHINEMHSWCLTRWGFPKTELNKECRIFCVPNKTLLKKLFNLQQSKVEFRKDLTVMWFCLDDPLSSIVPTYLTYVCLAEFEINQNVKLGWWFKKGSSSLNASVSDIRSKINSFNDVLKKDHPVYTSENIFKMTEIDYLKETPENQLVFDQQAMMLCIMLRKEFGEAKLQGFLRLCNSNETPNVLKIIYGFQGYREFDKQYIRFLKDLCRGVANKKTPDDYLEIKSTN